MDIHIQIAICIYKIYICSSLNAVVSFVPFSAMAVYSNTRYTKPQKPEVHTW